MIGVTGAVRLVQIVCLGGFVAVLLLPLLPRRHVPRQDETVAARRRLLRELRRYD